MRPPSILPHAWLFVQFVLVSTVLMQASLAAGQEPAAHLPPLAADVRSRLAEAAGESNLEPWQREFMLEVAHGRVKGSESEPLPGLPDLARPETGSAANDGLWTAVPPPSPRRGLTAIYDPVRDRMLVFGGVGGGFRNDVWTLTLVGSPAWSALAPAGTPPSPRANHTAFYDPVRDRMVVFGGQDAGGNRNDVWVLSLAGSPTWSALAPAGTPPPARSRHTAIYDPVRDRMLVFGGVGGGFLNDVWELSLAGSPTWSALAPAGPLPSTRSLHTAIYDPVRDRMVVFGGYNGTFHNDVWALTLAGSPAWSALAPAGTPPSARSTHTAIYDPVRDRMLVFGGTDFTYLNDVWVLTLAGSPAWVALAPVGIPPVPRTFHAAFYDPVRDYMVVVAGDQGTRNLNDVWALTLLGGPAWIAVVSEAILPPARYFHTGIYDPLRDRMVVFGGWDNGTVYRNDLWALSLTGSPTWTALTPTGGPPPVRSGHTAIYDPAYDRMVVFGGFDGSVYRGDVWALSLAGSGSWEALAPAGSAPAGRHGHSAMYDPVRERMVMFGGWDGGFFRNDVWVLSLGASPVWTQLFPGGTGAPTPRTFTTPIYDPVRDRMVMIGGWDAIVPRNDVWALSLAGSPDWSLITPTGTPPAGRYYHTGNYDPLRDRVVVFGGFDGVGYLNDVWSLSLAGTPAWRELAPAANPPSARILHVGFYDPVRDRQVVFGGFDGAVRNDLWTLGWDKPVSVAPDLPARLRLGAPRPNPSRGETMVDFELGEPARITIDVFDVHGRHVHRIAEGWFPAGRHASTWRGDDDRAHALKGGVYFIRMQGSGDQATRHMVRIR